MSYLYEYGRTTQNNYQELKGIESVITEPHYAATSISNDLTNTFDLDGVGSSDFSGETGFVPITGYTGSISNGMTFDVDGNIVASVSGDYKADAYLSMFNDTSNNTVAIKLLFNGVTLSTRPVPVELPNGGDYGVVSGNGMFYAEAGDVIGVAVASEKDAALTISDSTVDVVLLRAYTA